MAFAHGMKIGIFCVIHGGTGIANPVHGLAPGTDLGDHGLGRMAAAQTAHAQLAYFCVGPIGNIYIEQPGTCTHQLLALQMLHQITRLECGVLEVSPALVDQGKRNGRNAKEVALHGRANGA